MEHLAQDECRRYGVHSRLECLDHVSEGHGDSAQGGHSGHLPCRESCSNRGKLQQIILRNLRLRQEAACPHEASYGYTSRELDPRHSPSRAKASKKPLIENVVLDI